MREPDEAAMHSRKPKTEQWNACSRDENLFKRPLSRAEAIAEITYLTSAADNLLRHTVYVGLREDKPDDQVQRER